MAGPFARHRRRREEPAPDAPTEAVPARAPAGDSPSTEVVPAETAAGADDADATPRFLARGRLRRRLRFVRRAREIALRDLGGLVFDLHRFGRERGDLVDQKLAALGALDAEMRTLEAALDDRREVTVVREPGLASCPRCGALHASDAGFCSTCGLPLGAHAGMPAGPTPTGPAGRHERTAPEADEARAAAAAAAAGGDRTSRAS